MTNSADPDQLAFQKPTDLDLHHSQKQGISGFGMTTVKSPFSHGMAQMFCSSVSSILTHLCLVDSSI